MRQSLCLSVRPSVTTAYLAEAGLHVSYRHSWSLEFAFWGGNHMNTIVNEEASQQVNNIDQLAIIDRLLCKDESVNHMNTMTDR